MILSVVAERLVGGPPLVGIALALGTYALCMRVIAPGLVQDAVRLAYAKASTPSDHS